MEGRLRFDKKKGRGNGDLSVRHSASGSAPDKRKRPGQLGRFGHGAHLSLRTPLGRTPSTIASNGVREFSVKAIIRPGGKCCRTCGMALSRLVATAQNSVSPSWPIATNT